MTILFRWRTAIIAAVAFVACLLISHQTKDTTGVEGALSWLTFIGMWIAIAIFAVAIAGATIQGARRTRH